MAKKKPEDLKYGISKAEDPNAYQVAKQRNYYRPGVYINKETYPEVVEFLKSQPSASEYIISLILADMTKGKR